MQTKEQDLAKEILKNTKTIAIIGLSPNKAKDSYEVAEYLQKNAYRIIPVYPKDEIILGEKSYKNINDIKENIDTICVFRKSEALSEIGDDVLKRGNIKYFWSQLGIIDNTNAEKLENAGIKVIQNKCMLIEHQRLEK